MAILSYRDLDAWKVGMDAVVLTYEVTAHLPDRERYGLCSQMQRAAVSVPSNIAEGHGRKLEGGILGRSTLYFLRVALGSLAELDTQLEAAVRLKFVTGDHTRELADTIVRVRQIVWGMRRRERQVLAAKAVSVCVAALALYSLCV